MYNYWCVNRKNNPNCEFCTIKGDLQIEEEKEHLCPNNEEIKLKLLGRTVTGILGNKMTKLEIKQDRQKRSSQNFKKEVLPTFAKGSDEAIHFRKKYGYKG